MTMRSVGLESDVDLRAKILSNKLQRGQATRLNETQSWEKQHLGEKMESLMNL